MIDMLYHIFLLVREVAVHPPVLSKNLNFAVVLYTLYLLFKYQRSKPNYQFQFDFLVYFKTQEHHPKANYQQVETHRELWSHFTGKASEGSLPRCPYP